MSNSDDGFPSTGGGSDQTSDADSAPDETGARVPSPFGAGAALSGDSLADDLDLDDVDFDSIFGTSGKSKSKKEAPRKAPRLPPPLTKTPDRPNPPSVPRPAAPKKAPENPGRQGRQTLMGIGFGLGDESSSSDQPDASTGPAGVVGLGADFDSDFESEKTEIAMGLFDDDASPGATSPGQQSATGSPEEAAPEAPSATNEAWDDLGDFDSEKTNVTDSPLVFPEDMKESGAEPASPIQPTSQPFDDPFDEDDKTEIGVSIEMPTPGEMPDTFDARPPAPEPQAPVPEAQGFGFSNFDPALHAAQGAVLPAPIGVPEPAGGPAGGGAQKQEFTGEKTELLDSPFTNDPLTARLHVLEGPAAGQEFFVNSLRNTLGRGTNNTIVVPDVALSRQHMEIVNNGDGTYALRDLQSVNGTALNGTRIREADIFHGDRFEGGKSVFQFVLSGANIPAPTNRRVVPAAFQTGPGPTGAPVPEMRNQIISPQASSGGSSGLLTKLAIAAALVSVALIIGVGVLAWQQKSKTEAPRASVESVTPSGLYLEGVESVKARQWGDAERAFKQARAIDPELANVEAQLERIDRERTFETMLKDARALLDDGKRAAAVARVADIPRESVYFEDGQELLRENKKLTVDELYTQAMAAFGRDDLELAEEKIVEIRDIVPDHEGATRLEERVASAKEAAEAKVEEVSTASKSPRPRTKPRRKKEDDWGFGIEPSGGSGSSSGSTKIVNFTKGYSLYRSKRFKDAIAFFDDAAKDSDGTWASRAERTSTEIKKFQSSYDAGNKAYASGNWARAEKQLLAARRFDTAVAQNGFFGGEVSKKIAGAKAGIGQQKLAAGDYDGAYRYARDARNYDSSSKALRQLNSDLARKAKALYVQAVNKGKTDPAEAAKLCRTIMSMTDSGDDTHKKAKGLLKDL